MSKQLNNPSFRRWGGGGQNVSITMKRIVKCMDEVALS